VALGAEDSGHVMSRLGADLSLDGATRSLDDVLQRTAAVTRDDVEAVAQDVAAAPRTLVVVGPRPDGVAADARLEGAGWR